MPDEDLESVPNLEETHRNALSRQLEIASLRALADADQRTVYQALRNTKPRPTLLRVAEWQSYARSALSEAPDWQPTASFAVIFAQRRVGDSLERRLEVERTEMGPDTAHQEWTGWDCGSLCGWMRGQLGLHEDELAPSNAHAARDPGASRLETGSPRPAPADRVRLRIESAVVTDAVHRLDLIKASGGTGAQPVELTGPIRLTVTVTGARSGQQVQAAVWFRRHAQSGWSPHEPVFVPSSGQAEFDLAAIPAGAHDVRLLAWAADAGSTLAAVTLPRLAVRYGEERARAVT